MKKLISRIIFMLSIFVLSNFRVLAADELEVSLVKSDQTEVYVGDTVELIGGVDSNEKYYYQFYKKENDNNIILQQYSESNRFTFQVNSAGKSIIFLDVKNEENKIATKEIEIEVLNSPQTLNSTLVSNKTTKEYVDRSIVLTAMHTGGFGQVEYRFRREVNGYMEILQDYTNQKTFAFATDTVGTHIYYVDVKDSRNNVSTASFFMNVVPHPAYKLSGTIKNNKTSTEYLDRSIILTGKGQAGYGELEYQFSEMYEGKTTVKQSYSSINNYKFATTGVGTHTYYLDIKDAAGQTIRVTYVLNVKINPNQKLGGSLFSSKSVSQYVDRTVIYSWSHTGGYGNVQYRLSENYDGKTQVLLPYGTQNTYSFITKKLGVHTYYLDMIDEEGQQYRITYKQTVVVHPNYKLTTKLSNNKTTKEYADRSFQLTGTSAGGYGKIEYKLSEVYGRTTKVISNYSENRIFSLVTKGIGNHIYYLDAKDEEGQVVRSTYTMTVAVHPDFKLTGTLNSNVGSSVTENQSITLNATSAGGYGLNHKYRFSDVHNGKTTILQEASSNSSCSFNLSGAGQHTLYVEIIDSESQILKLAKIVTIGKQGWYYEGGYKLYYSGNTLVRDVRNIIGPQSSYVAKVNRTACTVTIYAKDGNNGYIIPVVAFACSVGLPSTPTPTGTFYTSNKYRWHTLMGPSYGQYCTRIVGGILFHSVAGYNMTPYNISASAFNKLGSPASHGCVRLTVRDAKWIYDNCASGMQVTIYDSSYPGPLGKPASIKIPSGQNWDPTDPAVNR